MSNESQILLYRAEDGKTQIQVKLQDETVWLTQAQMAELFQKDVRTINEHIQNLFEEGELEKWATIRKFRIVQTEGKRRVTREVDFYNLDVIISVGYRVKSHRGTQFRIWATQRLREYIVKGFVMDDQRLAGGVTNYFDELVERVRRIRTSERNFYEKVRDIFTTSIDYDPQTDYAQLFYATVQNKFHYAIHGHTAAELIAKRIDSSKEYMGLTNWSGSIITSKDAKIAKNYLEELELKRLELLVEQFLSFAELRSVEKKPMYMNDWLKKLDEFLVLNEKEILQHAGKVSHKEMEAKVRAELEKYSRRVNTKQIEGPKQHETDSN
ncbi:virulence RhuM family protein [candidate division KSB1 bacterium]|nr:virulence RhuM family protein [candidate division KSB1 bacterium]